MGPRVSDTRHGGRSSGLWIRLLIAILLLALPVACEGEDEGTAVATQTEPQATATVAPATATRPAGPTPTPTIPPGMFVNPVLDQDFPDPDILEVDGAYYAYATNSGNANIQIARSEDLVEWLPLASALRRLPSWAVQDFGWSWAPDVTAGGDGDFLMYFTARFAMGEAGGVQCIGLATSDTPEGPFRSEAEEPFICQVDEGGSIDAASFVDDDGLRYLLWKNDGNSRGGITWIYIQQLAADGLSLLGEPTRLIKADQAWEGILVEGPTLWKHDGRYYLFYSANDYSSPRYAVGYAVADSIFGPYQKAEDPLLETSIPAGVVGPGGQDIVLDADGDTWILFHGWAPGSYRRLYLAELRWLDGVPEVAGLGREPQPVPSES
jgi:beta-xylosidase